MMHDGKKGREEDPFGAWGADSGTPMDPSSKHHARGEGDPGAPRVASAEDWQQVAVLEELAHWDELEGDRLSRLAMHAVHGKHLERLQEVDLWLQRRVRALIPCPSAQELYHFGRGPGYEPLSPEQRQVIEEHLGECDDCAGWVSSLRASPPLPLDVSPPDLTSMPTFGTQPRPAAASEVVAGPFAAGSWEAHTAPPTAAAPQAEDPFASASADPNELGPQELARAAEPSFGSSAERPGGLRLGTHWPQATEEEVADERRHPLDRRPSALRASRLRPLLPLAAAAAVTWILVTTGDEVPVAAVAGEAGLPESPLLRGDLGGPLYFPRGRVLAQPMDGANSMAGSGRESFASTPVFEIEPRPGASLYRVILRRHDGSAFDGGRDIEHIESERPVLNSARSLTTGHYTWEAWAIVEGLDQRLGARDFEVVDEPGLVAELETIEDRPAVRRLHESGFLTDARALAKRLPASPERDAYLQALPGR